MIRSACLTAVALVMALAGTSRVAAQAASSAPLVAATVQESAPASWPALRRAPTGSPNVLLVMTDDVGFGASSTFGGPIPTPTFEALARSGLRYNQFHNAAMCSPTRAALLTGRNHTRVGMGGVTDRATGYDGYTTVIPPSAATVAEVLRQNGYSTAAFGKWHLAPLWESGPNGPTDHWPTRMGFDNFYGFLTGDTDQWAPTLYQDTTPVEPPSDDPDYLLDRDLVDRAIRWMRERKSTAPDKPFFMYLAPGTAHAPHHAPADWVARFKGKFDQGWDRVREETFARQKAAGIIPASARLTPRPREIPAWSTLTANQRAVYAREMETYAAALAYADDQLGRLIGAIRDAGQLDNTLVICVEGDNGGSGEGGLTGAFNEVSILNGLSEDPDRLVSKIDRFGSRFALSNYPAGWGWAMNTPFQWMKVVASHAGGNQTGMVMSWPAGIKDAGGIRSQYHHVVDIAPTILTAAKIAMPERVNGVEQMSVDGVPMEYSWASPATPSTRRDQFYTIYDNVGVYRDGWTAATRPVVFPWELTSTAGGVVDGRKWELYHVANDFSESSDLAASNPAKLEEMKRLFWTEAARNQALPIHRGEGANGRPSWLGGQTRFTFWPGTTRLLTANAPPTINRSFAITAQLDVAPGAADGMLVTHGGRFGGYGLYVIGDKLTFDYNLAGLRQFRVASQTPLAPGRHTIALDFAYDGGGNGKGAMVTIRQDGSVVAKGRVEQTLPRFYGLDAMFDVGEDTGTPITEDYRVPFRSLALRKLDVEVASPAK